MYKVKVEIELFEYEELSGSAKEKAFEDHEYFLRCNPMEYEDEDKDGKIITKYDDMNTWSREEIKDCVEDSIKANEYLFYSNGTMAAITHYTGKHEKAGKTELKIQDKLYEVNRC